MSVAETTTSRAPQLRRDESYRETLNRLASAQKARARGAPAYSIYVNRPLGRYLAAAAYRLGLTPNAVSAISAVFTFSAIILIAAVPPTLWLGITVWLMLAFGYLLDSADGQVARLRGGGTPAGEWLDHVLDAVKTSSLHLAVLIGVYLHVRLDSAVWLLVPIGFTVVASVTFFAIILNDQLKARYEIEKPADLRPSTPLRSMLGLPTDYGVLCLVFALFGVPAAFLVIYTALFAAHTAYLLAASVKWYRNAAALSRRMSA